MSEAEFVKRAWPKLIEATDHPLAPIILQDAHNSVSRLGPLMASQTDFETVQKLIESLLAHFTEADLEEVCHTPAFVMALSGMLQSAIEAYVSNVAK